MSYCSALVKLSWSSRLFGFTDAGIVAIRAIAVRMSEQIWKPLKSCVFASNSPNCGNLLCSNKEKVLYLIPNVMKRIVKP